MFTIKKIKILIILAVLALPLSACGQRASIEISKDLIEDSSSY
tara:strand:+ start:157115 stop:157243 length:129 start_codon:yes stop_codon:yes gene_type:complete